MNTKLKCHRRFGRDADILSSACDATKVDQETEAGNTKNLTVIRTNKSK